MFGQNRTNGTSPGLRASPYQSVSVRVSPWTETTVVDAPVPPVNGNQAAHTFMNLWEKKKQI